MREQPPSETAKILPTGIHLVSLDTHAFTEIEGEVLMEQYHCTGAVGITVREAQRRGLFVSGNDDRVYFYAGLTESVVDCLRRRGLQVSIEGVLNVQFVNPGEEHENFASPPFRQAILGRQRSLICAKSIFERFTFLEAIGWHYRGQHILVVVSNNATAADLARAMRMRTGWPASSGANESRSEPWLHFVSVADFVGRSYAIWPVVIFWDAALVVSRTVFEHLGCMFASVRFGFLGIHASRNLYDRLLVEAMFGPTLDLFDNADSPPIYFTRLLPPTYPAGRSDTSLERKRLNFWQNYGRNRQIAQAAMAILQMDCKMLRRLGLQALTTLGFKTPTAVIVLVENVEHGRAIQEHLEGWELHYADSIESTEAGIIAGGSIVTFARAEKAILIGDVLIYAAGIGNFLRADREPAGCTGYGQALTVVDVQDDLDEQAKCDVMARVRSYGRFGWKDLGSSN